MKNFHHVIDSPIGPITTVVDEEGAVVAVSFGGDATAERGDRAPDRTRAVDEQIGEYFAGQRRQFDLRLAARGTEFQRRVWDALQAIPFGETRSYGEIARAIGSPAAVRAVGRANGSNPRGLIVPCHRVIGADGSLTGYAGGLDIKQQLLAFEAGTALVATPATSSRPLRAAPDPATL